jgi:putative ABC transport system permease protein
MKRDPIWRRYRDLLRSRPHADAEEEVQFHLEMRAEEAQRLGMTPSDALAAASTRFGDMAEIAAELHRIDGRRNRRRERGEWWHGIRHDVLVAWRGLRRAPTFAITAVGTIGIAIAANTTIFSFVDALLFERLPYANPDALVVIRKGVVGLLGEALTIRERARMLADLAVYRPTAATLDDAQDSHDAAQVDGAMMTANMLPMLGARPAIGSIFAADASEPGNGHVILLGHSLWQSRFGAARDIVGRRLMVDGAPYTVIGVMPPTFEFPTAAVKFWVPLTIDRGNLPSLWATAGGWFVGRLRTGYATAAARRELELVVGGMRHVNPLWDPGADYGKGLELLPFRQHVVGAARSALLMLWSCAGVVLLVACVNLANLLLARATARDRELAIRAALGGGRARLMRQLLTESLLIAVLGSALSLLLTSLGTHWIAAAAPSSFPRLGDTGMRLSVYLFSAALTVGATFGFGLLPAWRATAAQGSARSLRFGRSGSGAADHHRVARLLIVGEIALAVTLAITGGLLARSFMAIRDLDPGFRTQHIVVAEIDPPKSSYSVPPRINAFYDAILQRAARLPGVSSVAAADRLPLAKPVYGIGIRIEGRFEDIRHQLPWITHFQAITPGYLETFGVPIQHGRTFASSDDAASQPVALVSAAMARKYWPAGDALGKRIGYPLPNSPWLTIVGIVPDVRVDSLRDTSSMAMYVPVAQRVGTFTTPTLSIAVRSQSEPLAIERAIRNIVLELDRTVAVSRMGTMDDVVAASLAKPRFTTALISVFALVGLLLGAVGVYGVMSYLVGQRIHEFGVRAALGASSRDITMLVLKRTIILAATGAVFGMFGAVLVSRSLAVFLYNVSPIDPLTFGIVTLGFIAVATIASAAPARRGARCDPVIALRAD